MNKLIVSLLLCVALVVVTFSLYDNVSNSSYVLQSTTGCCSITVTEVNDDLGIIQYVITYNTDDESEDDKSIVSPDELDETINMYQEYCYHYH